MYMILPHSQTMLSLLKLVGGGWQLMVKKWTIPLKVSSSVLQSVVESSPPITPQCGERFVGRLELLSQSLLGLRLTHLSENDIKLLPI